MAPDGKSLITSVGIEDSSVWIHDARGERQISSEGYGGAPQFSPDSRQLYYLVSYGQSAGAELWVSDLTNDASKPVLSGYMLRVCGVSAQRYSVSQDGTEIAFSMLDKTGHSKVWVAPTDRRSSPQAVESSADEDCPYFLPNGDLVFRAVEGDPNFPYRMKSNGTERGKISNREIFDPYGVSSDGRWVLAQTRGPDREHPYSVAAYPIDGDAAVAVCLSLCAATWDRTGKSLYLSIPSSGDENTYALPLQHSGLPKLPPSGISRPEQLHELKGTGRCSENSRIRRHSIAIRLYTEDSPPKPIPDSSAVTPSCFPLIRLRLRTRAIR